MIHEQFRPTSSAYVIEDVDINDPPVRSGCIRAFGMPHKIWNPRAAKDYHDARTITAPCRDEQRSASTSNDHAYGGRPRKRQFEDGSYDYTAATDVSGDDSFMDVKRQRIHATSRSARRPYGNDMASSVHNDHIWIQDFVRPLLKI